MAVDGSCPVLMSDARMAAMREAILRAMGKRAHLFAGEDLNAYRLFDGIGDGMAGVTVDHLDGHWLVATEDERQEPWLTTLFEGWTLEDCRSVYWKLRDSRRQESPRWVRGERVEHPFLIREHGVVYEMSFASGYSQGLFLDQRLNRLEIGRLVRWSDRVLNCFSYTCGFSVVAALQGAVTTSLDLSAPYLEWGKRNFRHNGLRPEDHFFCRGETFHWLGRFAKQGRRFRGVVLDPPTFSRSRDGGVFRAGKDYGRLVAAAMAVVEPGGWLLCSCNDAGMDVSRFQEMIDEGCREAGLRDWEVALSGMPEEFSGSDYLKSAWVALR